VLTGWIKMVMVNAITAKITVRVREMARAVEWVARKAWDLVREIAARMEMAARTGMGLPVKKQILRHRRDPKTRIKSSPLTEKPEYSYLRGYFGFLLFSNVDRNDGTGTGRRAYHSKQNGNSIPC
jgi:hypothetical protein